MGWCGVSFVARGGLGCVYGCILVLIEVVFLCSFGFDGEYVRFVLVHFARLAGQSKTMGTPGEGLFCHIKYNPNDPSP